MRMYDLKKNMRDNHFNRTFWKSEIKVFGI